MVSMGSCYFSREEIYSAAFIHDQTGDCELLLAKGRVVVSAYKKVGRDEYAFGSMKARKAWGLIKKGLGGCTAKNGAPTPFELGASITHSFTQAKIEFIVEKYNKELCGFYAKSDVCTITLDYSPSVNTGIPQNIEYVKLTSEREIKAAGDSVPVRSVQEIALEKEDISWLNKKKYYIINDETQAEQIFQFLENYDGPIAYDVETTGLKMNMFGKVNSKYEKDLIEWNEKHPDDTIRTDRLVGLIFCVEPDVSYYFPVGNRKFKNLYEVGAPYRNEICNMARERWNNCDPEGHWDMSRYFRENENDAIRNDVVLMERIRIILSTKHIVTHGGSIEWKTGWHYEIDTNIKDDTLVIHQLIYKFRSTTNNRGESSKLKHLSKVELGIDQWELQDFFSGFAEDESGKVRNKKGSKSKNKSRIDFSYMTYEGTRVYAPTDGDCTLLLFKKYKPDMERNYSDQKFIYSVEMIVLLAIGYMEFYGHRLDESKIEDVRQRTEANRTMLESEFREHIGYRNQEEKDACKALKDFTEAEADNEYAIKNTERAIRDHGKTKELTDKLERAKEERKNFTNEIRSEFVGILRKAIDSNTEKQVNLGSPAQVSKIFFETLGLPHEEGSASVDKKVIKGLLDLKLEDKKTLQYPIVKVYAEWKDCSTLLTKFFDNLQDFMYPGGYVFSSYGLMSTATGRMSCSKPNAQQYPKSVTAITIPHENHLYIDSDYSQIEYRVMVAISKEAGLMELFKDPDNDYHTLMASMMFDVAYASVTKDLRSDAKALNFGIPYGMGFKSLALRLTGKNGPAQIQEAKVKYELYFKNQPNVRKMFNQVKEMAEVNKYTKTYWNRYRYYSFDSGDAATRNRRKASALRQAGNAVIQGTAADIFKIAIARIFQYIRTNRLYGDFLICNMIHDEALISFDYTKVNPKAALRDLALAMEYSVANFPPLYVGAGFGENWKSAKGGDAEIHQNLLERLLEEYQNEDIRDCEEFGDNKKAILDYFHDMNLDFRTNKVKTYLTNPDNLGKGLAPVIGSLLQSQFNYGHNKTKEGLADDEMTAVCLNEFAKHNGLEGIHSGLFQLPDLGGLEEDDVSYEDSDETIEDDDDREFVILDESAIQYGCSLQDIIKQFGVVISENREICGIDKAIIGYKYIDSLSDYLYNHVCLETDPGAMEVVFLEPTNILNRTSIYVNNITREGMEQVLKGE